MIQLQSEQDAIKQAVEAGYKQHISAAASLTLLPDLVDPAFWTSLGKARGWPSGTEAMNMTPKAGGWKFWAMRYFETLLSGGDMQKFWETLP